MQYNYLPVTAVRRDAIDALLIIRLMASSGQNKVLSCQSAMCVLMIVGYTLAPYLEAFVKQV